MGQWQKQKVDASTINSGNRYEAGSQLSVQAVNSLVESGLYTQEFVSMLASNTPQVVNSDNGANASVALIDDGNGYKRFVFYNIKGATGPQGEVGPQGPRGLIGPTGLQGDKGEKGETGDAATVDVGEVTTGDAGTEAEVENVGTRGAAVLNFKIPAGQTSLASFATLSMASAPTVGKELAIAYSRLNRTPLVGEYGFSLCVNDTTGDTYMIAFQVQSLGGTTARAKVTAVTSTTGPQGPQGEKGEQGEMGAFIGTWDTGTSGTTVLPVAGLYEFKVSTPEVPSVTAIVNWNGTSASSSLFHWEDRDLQELVLGYFYITYDGLVYLRTIYYDGRYTNITKAFYYRKLGSAVDDIATTTALNTEV